MKTRRMTMAQALIQFLKQQYVERDGREHTFFAGMLGIFGHGNVAGIGQALQQNPDFPYILVRNEQAGVHMATGFAKASNRLRAFACTSSIGPGATNMITGAALATINRLPVLLLPGDIFARRNVAPVLQQIESPATQDIGVNDCFKPVSRYWDRIYRPEQLITALPEAMRVLTSPSDCGAVTLALPQDVQTEAYDYPEELFQKRVWLIRRVEPDKISLERAVAAIGAAKKPLIVAGGGVLMSEASQALGEFVTKTGIPVAETQAGKGVARVGPCADRGRDGRDGHAGGEPAGARGRPGDRHRHALLRFHIGIDDGVPESAGAVRQHQHRGVRRVQGGRDSGGGGRARGAGAAWRGAGKDYHVSAAICGRDRRAESEVGGRGRPAVPLEQCRQARAERSDWRDVGGVGPARRAAVGSGQPSRRPAQAVAHAHAQRLPHGIRLLVHGLRDSRRDGRQAGRSEPRGVCRLWATART